MHGGSVKERSALLAGLAGCHVLYKLQSLKKGPRFLSVFFHDVTLE
jgi:hypothetical protein